jgi:prolyl 4-hydroxylase
LEIILRSECAPACFSCELIDFDVRCPFNPNAPKAWENPGDLEHFFERLLAQTADQPHYSTTIFSGPAKYTAPADSTSSRELVTVSPNAVVDGPWIVTLDNVLTGEECEHLIQLGHVRGYERSMDVGGKKFDGTFDAHLNPDRTSTTAWCNAECYNDPLVQTLTARLENLIGVPSNNSEYWQLLKYEETQKYNEHHDYIEYQRERAEGVRILTVFFYLNTVEAGGGTRFPRLDLTVQPVQGRVLIWPSVLDEDPDAPDERTMHEALPVEKGIKYAANAWVHQRDYKPRLTDNCY